MSLHYISEKIKKNRGLIENSLQIGTFISLFIISYNLGVISVISEENPEIAFEKSNLVRNFSSNSQEKGGEKKEMMGQFVASKNGSKYYPKGCGGANRIKEENKVWFVTEEDAKKAGYELSSLC